MADQTPSSRPGVREESIVMYTADGKPTEDKQEADVAEISTTYDEGSVEHTVMHRSSGGTS